MLVMMAVSVLSMSGAQGAIKVWTGSTNTAWSQSNNWNPTGVPTDSDDVYIPDVANDPVIKSDAEAYWLQINDSAVLTVDGGTLNVTDRLRVMSDTTDATLDLSNNATRVNADEIYNWGIINIDSLRQPYVNLTGLYSYAGSVIKRGYGIFTFNGAGINTIFIAPADDLWEVHVDNPSGEARVTSFNGLHVYNLYVDNGIFNPYNNKVTVYHRMYVFDEVKFIDDDSWISVGMDLSVYSGAIMWGETGTLTVNDEIYVYQDAVVEFYGNHLLNVSGGYTSYFNIYEDSAYFNNVSIEKTGGWLQLNTAMNITDDLVIEEGEFWVQNAITLSCDTLTVRSGGVFRQMKDSNVTVNWSLSVSYGGTYELGNRTNGWDGGVLNLGYDLTVQGRVLLSGMGGEIFVDNHWRVYSSGNMTIEGGNITGDLSSSGTWFYVGSEVTILSSDTTLSFNSFTHHVGSRWTVRRSATPTIVVTNYLYTSGELTGFEPGHSTVVASGSVGITNIDTQYPIWNLIINKTAGVAKADYAYGTLNINGSLLLIDGDLDSDGVDGHSIRVNGTDSIWYEGVEYRGFANIGGELVMEAWNDSLEVTGGIYWGPESSASVTTGWIHCRGNWTFAAESEINLTGNNTVRFFGGMMGFNYEFLMNSSTSSFCNVLHGMGMTSSWIYGNEPMVIDNNLTFTSLNALFVEDADLIVWGDANVTSILYVFEAGQMYVHGNLTVAGGPGRIDFGNNGTPADGGSLNVRGWMDVWNPVNFFLDGGNLTVDRNLTVSRTGSVVFHGEGGNMSAANVSILEDGALRIYSSNTTIETGQLQSLGEFNISSSARPFIRISTNFNWHKGIFRLGRSEVRAVGSGDQRFEDSKPYWGLVVDKPSGYLKFEYPGTILAESYLGVAQGRLWVDDHRIEVRGQGSFPIDGYPIGVNRYSGFIMDGGELQMNHTTGVLDVTGFVRWRSGSTANATMGTIQTDASWTVYDSVDADILCPVVFDGSTPRLITIHSPDFTFRDLEIARSGPLTQTTYSLQPLHVTRDLWINNTDNYDDLNITAGLIVDRDIHITRGALVISHGAEVTVGDDVEMLPDNSNGWVRMFNGSMDVGGYFHCDGFGVQVAYYGGSMDITGPLWIDSNMPPGEPGFHVGQKDGSSFRLTAEFVRINASGYMNLSADNTRIVSLADFYNYGTLESYRNATPDIVTYDDFVGSGIFLLGHSAIWFEGSEAYQDVIDLAYWNLVVNKTAGRARSLADISVESCLFIMDGIYDMNGFKLWVNSSGNSFIWNGTHYSGFVNFGGELVYLSTDEELHVNGPVSWGPGVNQTFDMGTLYVNGSFEFMAGSQVNFTGSHLVYFYGMNGYAPYPSWAPIYSNSTESSFNDVTLDRDSGYGQYGSYLSTETMVVKGDVSQIGGYFDLFGSSMHVMGDIDIDGPAFNVETYNESVGSILDVDGNVYVQSGANLNMYSGHRFAIGSLNCTTLYVNGTLLLFEATSVWAADDIFIYGTVDYQNTLAWAELVAVDNIYINSPGYVDMQGSAPSYLNTTGDSLFLYNGGTLDLRGNAHVYVWSIIYVHGTLDCTGWFPKIQVGSIWYSSASGDFKPGWSEVTFFKSGSSYIHYTDRFADIIVNKPSGVLRLDDSDLTCSDLDVEAGNFDLFGRNLTATDDVTIWGSINMDHDGWINVSDRFSWMNGSSETITNGTIVCNGAWEIEDGADMTFEDPVHVYLNASTDVVVDDPDSYFNNVTFRTLNGGSPAYINGSEPMNVTSMLMVSSKVNVRFVGGSIDARYLYIYSLSLLNISSPDSELHVWDELWMDTMTIFSLDNGSYAWVQDFSGNGEIYIMEGSNLTVIDDLVGANIQSDDAMVYFTGSVSSSLSIEGRFHDLTIDKASGTSVYEPLLIGGDLRILDGTVYPQANDVEMKGDFYCDPSAAFRPANGSRLIFNGSGLQFLDTGGSDSNHALYDLIVADSDLIVQNSSVHVKNNITIEYGSVLWISGNNMTLYTGEDGLWNNGTLYFDGHTGKNAVEFYAGSNVTNNGTMTFLGNPTYRTVLRSSSSGTQWHLNDTTPELYRPAFDRVRVSDSDADPGETIYADGTSIDDGNNDNWAFGKPITLNITGLEGRVVNITVEQWGSTKDLVFGDGTHETWADSGTTATLEDEYIVTANEERYYTEDTTSWSMNDNVTASIMFYRQWKPTITLDGTDGSHTVSTYYSTLGGSSSQTDQHTSWSRWVDNGSALSFDKEASGTPTRHTGEDFTVAPWDPLTSALVHTLDYAGNEVPELINGSMDPSGGNMTTVFNFTVEYWDANNDAPLWVFVNIDETKLSGGDHDYYFICNDTYVTNQTSTETTGTIVPEFGMLPVMISVMMVGVAVIWRRRRK